MDWSKDVRIRYTVRSSVLEDPDTKFYVYRIFIKDYNDNSPKQGSYEECELKYILIEHDGNLHVVSVEGVTSGEDGYIPSICTREPVTVLPTPDPNQSSVTQYKPTDECKKFIIQQLDYLNEHDLLSYYAGFAPCNAKNRLMIDKISGEDILRLNQLVVTNIEFSPEQSALDWSRDSEMRTLMSVRKYRMIPIQNITCAAFY